MVQSPFAYDWGLQGDSRISEGGVVWHHLSNAESGIIDWGNIAEGSGRRSDGELTRFLRIARGSAAELEYHLLLARDLDLLSDVTHGSLARQTDEVQRMLTSLITQVQPLQVVREAAIR